eukprot:1111598-Pyramimonas_sp.AAC.1
MKSTKLAFDVLVRLSQAMPAFSQELSTSAGSVPVRAAPKKESNDPLVLTEHTLPHFPGICEWRCTVCNLYATAPATLAQLRSGSRRVCGPTVFQRWQACATSAGRDAR